MQKVYILKCGESETYYNSLKTIKKEFILQKGNLDIEECKRALKLKGYYNTDIYFADWNLVIYEKPILTSSVSIVINGIGEKITFDVFKMVKALLKSDRFKWFTAKEILHELRHNKIDHESILWAYNREI